ncbi:hypothetical protein IAR50_003806 [Cryptococcus sp. DSM 104548]
MAAVLDWDWPYTTTKGEAFASPFCGLRSIEEWYTGDNSLQLAELHIIQLLQHHGREDLANCIRQGHLYLRINETLYLESLYSMFYLDDPGAIIGIRSAFMDMRQQGVGGHVESLEE